MSQVFLKGIFLGKTLYQSSEAFISLETPHMQVLVHGRFSPGAVPPDNSLPLIFTARQLTLHNSPWINTPSNQVPLSITIAECFQLSLFESEFHLTEATNATEDPRRGHCLFLIRAVIIFYIIPLVLCY